MNQLTRPVSKIFVEDTEKDVLATRANASTVPLLAVLAPAPLFRERRIRVFVVDTTAVVLTTTAVVPLRVRIPEVASVPLSRVTVSFPVYILLLLLKKGFPPALTQ